MRPLWEILRLIWRAEAWSLLRGAALAVVVLVMGIVLLGLSGWFIVAAGAAGLAGAGAVFDVFRPSAAVRFLALGRTAARYGERLLTHDATLRALTALRVRLLSGIATAPFAAMSRFRSAQVLNRLTADVDALDGLALRLAIPLLAGGVTLAGAWSVLAWLTDAWLAAWSVLSLAVGSGLALVWIGRRSRRASRLAEAGAQAFRVRLIDHLRGRAMLAFAGQLEASGRAVLAADARGRAQALVLARLERRAGAALAASSAVAAAGALLIGGDLARRGLLSPPLSALAFFVTLAMAETVAPLRRGMAELGAMRDAARRVTRWLAPDRPPDPPAAMPVPAAPVVFAFDRASLAAVPGGPVLLRDVSLTVRPGETVALVGRSGAGKTTLLNAAAGLIPVASGRLTLAGRPVFDWPEADLRATLGYLPQRSVLVSGSVAANLRLAAPEATDTALRAVLERVALWDVVARIGGLDAWLGEAGRGLSGGEARRLALARVLLRAPAVLLLDEPTEGLDRGTALEVLAGIRQACPESAVLIAAHRTVERNWADRVEIFE